MDEYIDFAKKITTDKPPNPNEIKEYLSVVLKQLKLGDFKFTLNTFESFIKSSRCIWLYYDTSSKLFPMKRLIE